VEVSVVDQLDKFRRILSTTGKWPLSSARPFSQQRRSCPSDSEPIKIRPPSTEPESKASRSRLDRAKIISFEPQPIEGGYCSL